MDRIISARFYGVTTTKHGQPSFEACLKKVMALGENVAREVGDTFIQSTHVTHTGNRISGDLLRVQDENLPSLVQTKGKRPEKLPLSSGAGLGHHAAFLYDISLSMLAYQLTRNAVSLGLFNAYIAKVCNCAPFEFLPVFRTSELKQLNKMAPRTLLIKVADPVDLEVVEDEQRKLRASLMNLRGIGEGAYVRIQIGLGNRRGQLDKPKLRAIVSWLLEQRGRQHGGIGTVKVIGKDFEEGNVPLDFIGAQIGDRENLNLGSTGPDENYNKRHSFLENSMERNLEELKTFKRAKYSHCKYALKMFIHIFSICLQLKLAPCLLFLLCFLASPHSFWNE
jgi:hypothetical protein